MRDRGQELLFQEIRLLSLGTQLLFGLKMQATVFGKALSSAASAGHALGESQNQYVYADEEYRIGQITFVLVYECVIDVIGSDQHRSCRQNRGKHANFQAAVNRSKGHHWKEQTMGHPIVKSISDWKSQDT